MPVLVKAIFAVVLFGLLTACSQPTLEAEPSSEFGSADLYPVKSSGFAQAYARRDAALSRYTAVDIRTLDVSSVEIPQTAVAGTLRRDWLMTPEREAALQKTWAEAMSGAFSSYERAGSGKNVLRITAQLTRVAPGRPTATTVGGALHPTGGSQDVVEIWMEFRLYDGGSGQLLAVIRDNRTMTSAMMSRTTPFATVELFRSWAALLHTRVAGR